MYDDLGGDDLLPGFVDVGSLRRQSPRGALLLGFAPRVLPQRLVQGSRPQCPDDGSTSTSQRREARVKAHPGTSGIYFPDRTGTTRCRTSGRTAATSRTQNDDGSWTAQLESDGSIAGLNQIQQVMQNSSVAPKDGDETDPQVPWCENKIGQLSAPSWVNVVDPRAPADADAPGCPKQEDNLGVFALPGMDGGAARVFAGGSNLAISANSQHPRTSPYDALKIMLSDDYQTILGNAGLVPAEAVACAAPSAPTRSRRRPSRAAANAKLTPAPPNWADVERAGVMQDLFVQVAQGGDVTSAGRRGRRQDQLDPQRLSRSPHCATQQPHEKGWWPVLGGPPPSRCPTP